MPPLKEFWIIWLDSEGNEISAQMILRHSITDVRRFASNRVNLYSNGYHGFFLLNEEQYKKRQDSNDIWENNSIQFPRLLAEINANVDMRNEDWDAICDSMGITTELLNELFDRALAEWERIKAVTL